MFRIIGQFSVSLSNFVRLFSGIYGFERQPKSHVCEMQTGDSLTERTSADVGLKKSPGYYMKPMLKTNP